MEPFAQESVIARNAPSLVSTMCFSIRCRSEGAIAQRPSASYSGGRFPARLRPSANMSAHAFTPAMPADMRRRLLWHPASSSVSRRSCNGVRSPRATAERSRRCDGSTASGSSRRGSAATARCRSVSARGRFRRSAEAFRVLLRFRGEWRRESSPPSPVLPGRRACATTPSGKFFSTSCSGNATGSRDSLALNKRAILLRQSAPQTPRAAA